MADGTYHTWNQKLRLEAIARGEVKYIGTPCPHGHTGLRYTSGQGPCVECNAMRERVQDTYGYKFAPTKPFLYDRLEQLESALGALDPNHPLLRRPDTAGPPKRVESEQHNRTRQRNVAGQPPRRPPGLRLRASQLFGDCLPHGVEPDDEFTLAGGECKMEKGSRLKTPTEAE